MTTAYAAVRGGLLVATDEGSDSDWRTGTRFDGQHLECVAVPGAKPDRVFCGTFGSGLYRSDDAGETFERVGAGDFESDQFTAVAVSPFDPDVVWAGTEPSAVYRSRDGGDTWVARPGLTDLPSADDWFFPPRPDSHRVRSIGPSHRDPDRLFVGIELGAFATSPDGGETWTEDVPGARRDTHQIRTHPDDPDRLYAASGFGYAESDDGGVTWTRPDDGLPEESSHLWSVAPDPGDPGTVLASTSEDAFDAHFEPADSSIHRYRNGAWERLDGRGLPTGASVRAAALDSGHAPGEFYAVTNHGLFRTTDAGDAWTRLDVDWPAAFGDQDPRALTVVA